MNFVATHIHKEGNSVGDAVTRHGMTHDDTY